jgi:thioredoxin reductase
VPMQDGSPRFVIVGAGMAGLTAAFVFAVQMLTFPIGAGTSG